MLNFIDLIGYSALITNLISMTMKNITGLRILAATANFIYIIYGVLLNAYPIIIGCSIAVFIHLFHLRKIILSNKLSGNLNC